MTVSLRPPVGADADADVRAALAAYPHLGACRACAAYVRGAADDARRAGHPAAGVLPWTLSFHESGHRHDPRTAALEHFAL